MQFARVQVRNDLERLDVTRGHRLEPHRLPDAGGRGVIDAARPEDLFAARLRAGVGRVPDADDQLLLAFLFQGFTNIEAEAVVATLVFAQFLAVNPNRRLPIDRAEMEQEALPLPSLGHGKQAPIPEAVAVLHDTG